MKFDSQKHYRRSVRLPDNPYLDGAYFVTICTHERECAFGEVVGDMVELSGYGKIAHEEWLQTGIVRPYVKLDAFVVMPNHIHAILFLVGAWRRHAPTPEPPFAKPIAHSLGTILGGYKSIVTRKVNELRVVSGASIWQRNYHEHVIRDEKSLNALREYIQFNPARWAEDQENPIKK